MKIKLHTRAPTLLVPALLVLVAWGAAYSIAPAVAQEQGQNQPKTQADAPPPTDPATPAPRSFQELDANGDGHIAKDEAAVDPALTQTFGTLDQDADGKLTPAEYQAYKPATPDR